MTNKYPIGHPIYYLRATDGERRNGIVADPRLYPASKKSEYIDDPSVVWACWEGRDSPAYITASRAMSDVEIPPLTPVGTIVVFSVDEEPPLTMSEDDFNTYYKDVAKVVVLAKVTWAQGQGL